MQSSDSEPDMMLKIAQLIESILPDEPTQPRDSVVQAKITAAMGPSAGFWTSCLIWLICAFLCIEALANAGLARETTNKLRPSMGVFCDFILAAYVLAAVSLKLKFGHEMTSQGLQPNALPYTSKLANPKAFKISWVILGILNMLSFGVALDGAIKMMNQFIVLHNLTITPDDDNLSAYYLLIMGMSIVNNTLVSGTGCNYLAKPFYEHFPRSTAANYYHNAALIKDCMSNFFKRMPANEVCDFLTMMYKNNPGEARRFFDYMDLTQHFSVVGNNVSLEYAFDRSDEASTSTLVERPIQRYGAI
jgi:hypothetical protein